MDQFAASELLKRLREQQQQQQPAQPLRGHQLAQVMNELQTRLGAGSNTSSELSKQLTQQQLQQALQSAALAGVPLNDILKAFSSVTPQAQLPANPQTSVHEGRGPSATQAPLTFPFQGTLPIHDTAHASQLLGSVHQEENKNSVPALLSFSTLVNVPHGQQNQSIQPSANTLDLDQLAVNMLRQQQGGGSPPVTSAAHYMGGKVSSLQETTQALPTELHHLSNMLGALQGHQATAGDFMLSQGVATNVDTARDRRLPSALSASPDLQMLLDSKARMDNTSLTAERRAQRKRARETHEQLSDPSEPFESGDASLEQQRAHKRMMKNRASAARSRQRKQAYVDELEDKVRQLEEDLDRAKKEIEELQQKLNADKKE